MEMRCSRLSLAPSSSSVSSSEGNFALGRLDGSLGFATGQAPAPSSPTLLRSVSGFEQGISSARQGREVCEVRSFVRSFVGSKIPFRTRSRLRGALTFVRAAAGNGAVRRTANWTLVFCTIITTNDTLLAALHGERAAEPSDAPSISTTPFRQKDKDLQSFLPRLSFDFGTFLEKISDFPWINSMKVEISELLARHRQIGSPTGKNARVPRGCYPSRPPSQV